MPTILLHPPTRPATKTALPPASDSHPPSDTNPLPPLLRTPSGLALIEIQGTLHSSSLSLSTTDDTRPGDGSIPIGELIFPLSSETEGSEDKTWQKKVHLYVGGRQRLVGEVKELRRPVAVVRRRREGVSGEGEDLEIVEIVRHKVLFAQRPEPV